jgi:GR25 family glycosyltransferase involved in LPS biosynthesis
MSLNWEIYKCLNPDLCKAGLKTPYQYIHHFIHHGKKEGRKFNIYHVTPDFNHEMYKNNNPELRLLNNHQLELHWLEHGRFEGKKCVNIKLNYINGIDKIYWINLNRSIARRAYMENLLKNINIANERVQAIDGNLDMCVINNYKLNEILGTNLEYACLLSHLKTINKFNESVFERCLILEDDVSLEFMKYWKKDINTIINEAPENWDIIMLSYTDLHCGKYNKIYVKWHKNISSAVSYIINKKGSNKVMNMFIDGKWHISGEKHVSDYIIYNKCITYVYKYSYFTTNDLGGSNIHNSNLRYHFNSKNAAELVWLKN